MKNKAIIFDLDGTAVDSPEQKSPSEELIQAVARLSDQYYLCAATGRVWTYSKSVLQQLNLSDPCVISAGTQICDPLTGKILWQRTIEENALNKAVKILQEYGEYKLLYNDNDEHEYFHGGIYPKDFAPTEPVYFLEQVFIPDAIAPEIQKKLLTIEGITCVMVSAQKPATKDLHVVDSAATKEHAIAELLKIINVDRQNTIGIGDGHNDMHLFNAVNYKVAMENAVPELKEAADKIIGSVKHDGLSIYLRSLI